MKLTGYPENCAFLLEWAFGVRFPDAQCTVEKDGSVSLEWGLQSTPPTPAEVAAALPAAQAAASAHAAALQQITADAADLKAQFQAAHDRLVQIRDGAAPTNAQVIAAVRDIAGYEIKILRALYGLLSNGVA